MLSLIKLSIIVYLCSSISWGRLHKIKITNDTRNTIPLSCFGYYKGGILQINLNDFTAFPEIELAKFGLSLDHTKHSLPNSWAPGHCVFPTINVILFHFDLANDKLKVQCFDEMQKGPIYSDTRAINCTNLKFNMKSYVKNEQKYFNVWFSMLVNSTKEEGLYSLLFHKCRKNEDDSQISVNFNVDIVELNQNSYLSAGEIPLPIMFWTMAMIFSLSGIIWIFTLTRTEFPVSRVHHLMSMTVVLKAISLGLQGTNFYYIGRLGVVLQMFSTPFYIIHFINDILLYTLLFLIGCGWKITPKIVSPREKVLLVLAIFLRLVEVGLSTAVELYSKSNEGHDYSICYNFVIVLDFISTICLLIPAFWSMRYFQKASKIHNNIKYNVKKFKSFKNYFIMLICYIYLTGTCEYLLKISVSFQYVWLHIMLKQIATFILFILIALEFHPTAIDAMEKL